MLAPADLLITPSFDVAHRRLAEVPLVLPG
jgi:hypothetical protein